MERFWVLLSPSVKTLDFWQKRPVTVPVRSNDCVESLRFVLSLSCCSYRDLPSMAFIATCWFHVDNLMVKFDHWNESGRIILQILEHSLLRGEQLCPLREWRVGELHQHMGQVALEALVHRCVELG